MLLKKNVANESFYWITLKEVAQVNNAELQPGTNYRLDGASVKAIYTACLTITPALIEA